MERVPPQKGRPDPRRREPLWDRIDRNRFRLVAYIALFSAVSTGWIAVVAWALAHLAALFAPSLLGTALLEFRSGVAAGLVLSAAYVWWTLARSERWLVKRLGGVLVPKGELLGSKMALKDMAIASGMPVAPAFFHLASSNTNAFVFHALGRRPVLGVTQGFIDKLSVDEQRAVFANLVARLVSGDTMVASATTALVAPLQAWRDYRIGRLDDEFEYLAAMGERHRYGEGSGQVRTAEPAGPDALLMTFPLLPFGVALIVLGEVLASTHRRSQLTAAEKADAEGMLLLKDPPDMLSALQRCVDLDNVVPAAGEALGELFYCWTGDSTNDEDDPEWQRVARLREVLGVEGWVPADAGVAFTPAPPRLDTP